MEEQNKEHDAWVEMFEVMKEKFNLSSTELNKPNYRVVFEMVERWAYYDRLRRKALKEIGSEFADDKGIFWKGEQHDKENLNL